MMPIIRQLLMAGLIVLIFTGCSDATEQKSGVQNSTTKGTQQGMKTYTMGRFAIDLPKEFTLEMQSHRFRLVELEEYPNVQDMEQQWKSRLSKIEKLEKPEDVKKIIIKEQPIEQLGKWARGVLYYHDSMADDEAKWEFSVSYGHGAVLFSLDGLLDKEKAMFARVLEVSRAYSPYPFKKAPENHPFYTQHGVIELPYKRQESTYARFAGPMEMKLEIEMNETHEVEKAGLLESLTASVATNFAPGVDVDKIRAKKRTVAGLKGEELFTRLTDDTESELYFGWKYSGKEDSGEHPEIEITIDESPNSNLDEKLKIWDQIMDSFRPAYQR